MHYGPSCVSTCRSAHRIQDYEDHRNVMCSANTVLNYLSDRAGLAKHAVASNHDGNTPGQLRAAGYLVCPVEMSET